MIFKIHLKGPSCDVNNCLETCSSFVADVASVKPPDHGFDWKTFDSFTRYKRTIVFMLRLLPSHAQFRVTSIKITDSLDLDMAENKFIHLSQVESFPFEMKSLTSDKPI